MSSKTSRHASLSFDEFKATVLADYALAVESREASLIGRREVLTGKAKFGIFGDGKEVAQLAWAKVFRNGDFRSGYYRDQTFMMAIGALTTQQFFASLYADTDPEREPASAGRQMNGHFATRSLDEHGNWKNLTEQKNSSADISPTAGQMPRLLGLAQASKIYRNLEDLKHMTGFSNQGNEVAWGTIGNASTSEGPFFETINAAGVLQVPMVICIWDDDYGISVHSRHQTTKQNISEILKGFQRDENGAGYEIITARGWDYPGLVEAFERASAIAREEHVPVLLHVREMTQPQGHSTSGSHERYKSKERLEWEAEYDCLSQMRLWMRTSAMATDEELDEIEKSAKKAARDARAAAWKDYREAIEADYSSFLSVAEPLVQELGATHEELSGIVQALAANTERIRKDILGSARRMSHLTAGIQSPARLALLNWIDQQMRLNAERYSEKLYTNTALNVSPVAPVIPAEPNMVDGRVVLRENFDAILAKYPEVLIFGEDSGTIGDVNQGLEGLQAKYGELRVSDTGIREATILGQGIGMAMRGLRPIAEIQYLDYLLYALQIMSDDLSTVLYRTRGGQKAPVIIRTRGHRLEGIWHSGSPMGTVLNSLRGIHVLVPRNMTKAAGFYNTLLRSDEPALLVECLNGYRLKEALPENLGEFCEPLGQPEVIREGSHLTVVTYGSTCRVVMEAADMLAKKGIELEVVDVQTLLPFDLNHSISSSLAKTNRLLVVDEDVPGGASAFILKHILQDQNGYRLLDSAPVTLTAKEHRPAYGTDGDYFSKPSADDVFETAYALMSEAYPAQFPPLR